MATTLERERTHVPTENRHVSAKGDHKAEDTRLSPEEIWSAIEKQSFLIESHVTPSGEPRSSGVMYKTVGRRLYLVVAPDGWKAKHIPLSGKIAVTVPVRRGGPLSLVFPIPPATISFHGTARVLAKDAPARSSVVGALGVLLPPEKRNTVAIVEIVPEGTFVTYGIGVSLAQMRDTELARARVPVTIAS